MAAGLWSRGRLFGVPKTEPEEGVSKFSDWLPYAEEDSDGSLVDEFPVRRVSFAVGDRDVQAAIRHIAAQCDVRSREAIRGAYATRDVVGDEWMVKLSELRDGMCREALAAVLLVHLGAKWADYMVQWCDLSDLKHGVQRLSSALGDVSDREFAARYRVVYPGQEVVEWLEDLWSAVCAASDPGNAVERVSDVRPRRGAAAAARRAVRLASPLAILVGG